MYASLWSNVISVLCSKTFDWGGEMVLVIEETQESVATGRQLTPT